MINVQDNGKMIGLRMCLLTSFHTKEMDLGPKSFVALQYREQKVYFKNLYHMLYTM